MQQLILRFYLIFFKQNLKPEEQIYLNGKPLKKVDNFRYLGSQLKSSRTDFYYRRGLAWTAFECLNKICQAKHIPVIPKVAMVIYAKVKMPPLVNIARSRQLGWLGHTRLWTVQDIRTARARTWKTKSRQTITQLPKTSSKPTHKRHHYDHLLKNHSAGIKQKTMEWENRRFRANIDR